MKTIMFPILTDTGLKFYRNRYIAKRRTTAAREQPGAALYCYLHFVISVSGQNILDSVDRI